MVRKSAGWQAAGGLPQTPGDTGWWELGAGKTLRFIASGPPLDERGRGRRTAKPPAQGPRARQSQARAIRGMTTAPALNTLSSFQDLPEVP